MTQRIVTVGDNLLLPPALKKTVEPAVVFTYDDGAASLATIGQPIFVAEGVPATAFVNASSIGNAGKLTWAQVEAFADNYYSTGTGYEIQCHENEHNYFKVTTRAKAAALCTSIETGLATLRTHGIIAQYLAYPGHQLNKLGQEIAKKYYLGARRSDYPRINTIDNVDMYNWGGAFGDGLKLTRAESASKSFEQLLEDLIATPGIATSCFHSFEPGYAATTDGTTIQTAIGMAKAAGIRIIPFSQACQELSLRGRDAVPVAALT